MSCLFCCFKCCVLCGCRDLIISKYAFYPPKPTYQLQEIPQKDESFDELENQSQTYQIMKKTNQQLKLYKLILIGEDGSKSALPDIPDLNVLCYKVPIVINSVQTRQIAAMYIEYLTAANDYVILFSHGNSTDLGYMLDSYLDLAFNCKINVFSYDYGGYGQSNGKATDYNMMQDITAAYNFLINNLKFEWNKIIVYGQSLGTGPSTFLASHKYFPVAGLVLHSGYASGLRILLNGIEKTHPEDFFPTIEIIQFVNAPVYIIHGTKDQEIKIKHAQQLQNHIKNLYPPWWVEGGGHNDIENDKRSRKDYFFKLKDFLQHLIDNNKNNTQEDVLKINKASDWQYEVEHIYFSKRPVLSQRPYSAMKSHLKEDRYRESYQQIIEEQATESLFKQHSVVRDSHKNIEHSIKSKFSKTNSKNSSKLIEVQKSYQQSLNSHPNESEDTDKENNSEIKQQLIPK